jgi:Transposase DDE domain
MDILIFMLSFLNPLNSDSCLYKSLSELMIAKLMLSSFTINNAKNRGILHLSNSYHYKSIKRLGKLFISKKIILKNFIFHYKESMSISDATLLKRSGKKVYGAKKLVNYVTQSYETLQDLLITVEKFNGLNFITDFKIINHNKRHLTKPEQIALAISSGEIKKNSWFIIDGGLKSKELLKEARINSIKLITRLNKNFVVSLFGIEFREKDIFNKVNPIKRVIKGKSYIIYPLKRCIWNKVAGNLFLVKGEEYTNFMPLFTISLKSKPETIIHRYMDRSSIEQTNKESKSYLNIEGSYFRKKESNYGYLFITFLTYNFIQYLRLELGNKSFKEVKENLSFYLLPNKKERLLAPTLLRTVRESFPSYGSSLS